jgi:hypothetical protein
MISRVGLCLVICPKLNRAVSADGFSNPQVLGRCPRLQDEWRAFDAKHMLRIVENVKAFNRLNRRKKKARPEHDLAFGRIRPN